MENWQDATSRQVELLARRLSEVLSGGLDLLHSELGVDLLGLKPWVSTTPPWVILLTAGLGLLLMVAFWASACRRLFFRKQRPTVTTDWDDGEEDIGPAVAKPVVKSEEKKRKKKSEKKAQTAQPNGSAVAEQPQEEAIVSDEIVPHHHQPPPPEVKAEKASEVKKSKKKAKQVAKETKTAAGKEPEDGTWETKVSNKEKRGQRKKDKDGPDGGGDSPTSTPLEPAKAPATPKAAGSPRAAASPKAAQKKKKVNGSEEAAPPPAAVTGDADAAATVPSHAIGQDQRTTNKEPASLWGTEIDGSWTVIDSGTKTSDVNLVSFSGLGVGAAEPVTELPWLSRPLQADDEWSGLNGGSVDPGSDWNAPSEAWVNYEEPAPPQPPAPQEEPAAPQPPAPREEPAAQREEPLPEPAAKEEDEEEKAETKTKKKKKKKKKAAEEGGAVGQEVEEPEKEAEAEPEAPVKVQQVVQEVRVERTLKENVSQKVPATQGPQKTPATQGPQKTPATQKPQKTPTTQGPQKAPATQGPQKTPAASQGPQKAPAATQGPQKPADAEPTAEQNNLPDTTQHKKAEDGQGPKPAKKKKARRET